MKRCARCERDFPLEGMAKDPRRPDGRTSYCRECNATLAYEWRQRNVEKARERDRARYAADPERRMRWHRENPERVKELKRLARARNLERERERDRAGYAAENAEQRRLRKLRRREHYLADRERVAELRREWRRANPEAVRDHAERQRARKLGAYVEPVSRLLALELYDGACGICGEDVDPYKFDLDHVVPLAAGGLHNQENMQPAHASCNRAKGARLLEVA